MEHQILGTTMPVLSVSLSGGESVVAEVGEFSWMTDSIQMSTGMGGSVGGQGLMGALKRKIGGREPPLVTLPPPGNTPRNPCYSYCASHSLPHPTATCHQYTNP